MPSCTLTWQNDTNRPLGGTTLAVLAFAAILCISLSMHCHEHLVRCTSTLQIQIKAISWKPAFHSTVWCQVLPFSKGLFISEQAQGFAGSEVPFTAQLILEVLFPSAWVLPSQPLASRCSKSLTRIVLVMHSLLLTERDLTNSLAKPTTEETESTECKVVEQ